MESKENIVQNLRDAGCDEACIRDFVCRYEQGKPLEALRLLTAHHRHLLDTLHQEQKRIDCLDYLVYQMRKAGIE